MANLDKAMRHLMTEVSREITRLSGRTNQTFGGPHHPTLIKTHQHYLHAYKYVYRNPIDARMVERAEEYPFSTLHALLGMSHLLIPLLPDDTFFNDVEGTLSWINCGYEGEARDEIRRALRKKTFSFAPLTTSRRVSDLETKRP